MSQWVAAGLMIATGLVAAGVGCVVARQSLRTARRAYHRTTARSSQTLEGWEAWFLQGFSGLSMGMRWLAAAALWAGWTVGGLCLIGLGIRLF